MKQETTSSTGEGDGGTAAILPLPVSEEFISRLAGRCEEIFPLNDRLHHEISNEEIREMESLLKRLQPAPPTILFREQCCSLMCSESEQEMETRLKKLSAVPPLEFSLCKMAHAMEGSVKESRAKAASVPLWWRLMYISGVSIAAAVAAVLVVQNVMDVPEAPIAGHESEGAGTAQPLSTPRAADDPVRKATIFELQGADERVPVLAPAAIRKIVPAREY